MNAKPRTQPDLVRALAALHAAEAAISDATGPLQTLSAAAAKAQAVVDAHAASTKLLETLKAKRKAISASRYLGEGDETEWTALEAEIAAAAAQRDELAADAEAAEGAIATLNDRYASAAATVRALDVKRAAAKHAVLERAVLALTLEYGEQLCIALDRLCEIVLLTQQLNACAEVAGVSRVAEPLPVIQFPAPPLGGFLLQNTVAATQQQIEQGRARLAGWLKAKGLDDLG
jgi:hypothetical protein